MVRPVVPPAPVHIDKTLNKKAASSKQSKKLSAKQTVALLATPTAAPQKSRRKKAEPSRRKAKKLVRKMLALQRSTEPLLPKTVIKSLARDAAPGKRFTKSSLSALGSAVEAYAQGKLGTGRQCAGMPGAHLSLALQVSSRPQTRSAQPAGPTRRFWSSTSRRRCRFPTSSPATGTRTTASPRRNEIRNNRYTPGSPFLAPK